MAPLRGQLRLFDSGPSPLRSEPHDPPTGQAGPGGDPAPSSQLLLFTDRVVLVEALRRSAISGDYEEAARIEERLRAGWREEAVPAELRFVRTLGPGFREIAGRPAEALEAWADIERSVGPGTVLWRRMRNGFFGRLLSRHSAGSLAGLHPGALRLVVATLRDLDRAADGRILVRDALVAGARIDLDGVEDPPVADLLAEELGARWLASLGAIRGLWPLTRPTPEETGSIAAAVHDPLPPDEEGRAMAFWESLRLAELHGSIGEPLLHAARKRLKILNGELHALYLYGTGPFSEGEVSR
jgi:hypothetical protein